MLATKVRGTVGSGPNDVGLSRKHIMQQVDASLKKLQTDYIDLYQVCIYMYATCSGHHLAITSLSNALR